MLFGNLFSEILVKFTSIYAVWAGVEKLIKREQQAFHLYYVICGRKSASIMNTYNVGRRRWRSWKFTTKNTLCTSNLEAKLKTIHLAAPSPCLNLYVETEILADLFTFVAVWLLSGLGQLCRDVVLVSV